MNEWESGERFTAEEESKLPQWTANGDVVCYKMQSLINGFRAPKVDDYSELGPDDKEETIYIYRIVNVKNVLG